MEEKPNKHKKDLLLDDNNLLKGSTLEKIPLEKGETNYREGAMVFQVYNPKEDKFETKNFYKIKKDEEEKKGKGKGKKD